MLFMLGYALSASAQGYYYQDEINPGILHHIQNDERQRNEIVIPSVNGYNVYKADLHVHTFFSDGHASPEFRVKEGYLDGLDIMAITDHIEYRPNEKKMAAFLKVSMAEGEKGKITSDLNCSVKLAQAEAEKYAMTLIPGIEITRDPKTVGHFNALFTIDNNSIPDPDPYVAIQNAKAQNAIVMYNHPGWARNTVDMTSFEKRVLDAGLIDGIETMNGSEFYPRIITRARDWKLFVSSNTDIHPSTYDKFFAQGVYRNMTFVLAKDKSPESVREALLARRTLAYSFGTIAGEEQLVRDFFESCVQLEVLKTDNNGRKRFTLRNMSSITFVIARKNSSDIILKPFTSLYATAKQGEDYVITVKNLWIPGETNPEFSFKLN